MIKNALYAQSGGVTAVINASACGVIETARQYPDAIGKVFAGRNGILGVLNEDLIDTAEESDDAISALRHTPSGAFGSGRYKLGGFDQQPRHYDRLVDVFRAHDIGYFFYNGGGDSADTCLKVASLPQLSNTPVKAIHIPKTIDNDLPETDSSPGYGSAAKYVAVSVREASYDVRTMPETSTKVFVLEVMGRHAGWLAAAGGLAADGDNDLPIVILFPEIAFDQKKFLTAVHDQVRRYGYSTVVVSEGCKFSDGTFLADQGRRDAFGHLQLGGAAPAVAGIIQQAFDYKTHWAVADYLQRSARHVASGIDLEQAYAVGKAAVEMAVKGQTSVMPAIQRLSSKPYSWQITPVPLERIANREKFLPRDFISRDGFAITERCREYLMPVIQGEPYPPYKNGLPDYITLKNSSVAKRLDPFEP